MDVVTYALLSKKIQNVTLAYSYKGGVATVDDLPDDAATDTATATGTGTTTATGIQPTYPTAVRK